MQLGRLLLNQLTRELPNLQLRLGNDESQNFVALWVAIKVDLKLSFSVDLVRWDVLRIESPLQVFISSDVYLCDRVVQVELFHQPEGIH